MSDRHSTMIMAEAASDAQRAANQIQQSSRELFNYSSQMENLVRQFRMLTEDGYGNNVSLLIELLHTLSAPKNNLIAELGEAKNTITSLEKTLIDTETKYKRLIIDLSDENRLLHQIIENERNT